MNFQRYKHSLFIASYILLIISHIKGQRNPLDNFPKKSDPIAVGKKIIKRFLSQPHSQYGSPLRAHEPKKQITYPDVCTWLGGFWFAEATGDRHLFHQLEKRFEPLFTTESYLLPKPNHVDNNVFGVLPLELYKSSRLSKYYDMGMPYADTQWALPENATDKERYWYTHGYSWQTRIWLDDMFMITSIQAQAFRITKGPKYINRAAKEMVLYLDSIQLSNGLFYHSPSAHFCWGRGNGWMAVGMTELLRVLPDNDPDKAIIMKAYLKMMTSLKGYQSKTGMWRQVVDDTTMWEESSSSAMFTYAMIVGIKKGWLDKKQFGDIARKAWIALTTQYIDDAGDVMAVCEGTDIGNNSAHYRNRRRVTGDLHGQAPVLWCAFALISKNL